MKFCNNYKSVNLLLNHPWLGNSNSNLNIKNSYFQCRRALSLKTIQFLLIKFILKGFNTLKR